MTPMTPMTPMTKPRSLLTARRRLHGAAAACLLAALAAVAPQTAWAQADWPSKPIKIVVPYAPGGSSDMLGRLIARHLQDALKQAVVVENKGGAGGVIGSKEVAKAAPDGYTLVVSGIGSHVIAPIDQPGAFDPMKDFTHIAMLAGPPLGMVVNAEQPIKDVRGFITAAQTNVAGISWGSPGQGTHGHLTGELFRQNLKLNMVHISYKGAGPAVADLLGNQIPAAFMTLSSSNAHVDTGKLRLLAVSSAKRVAQYPNTPTLAELGYPQLTGTTWFSISGPAGMPRDVVDKLNAEIRRGLQTPALMKALANESMETLDLDAVGFTKYVAAEIARWTPAVKSLGGASK
jgi:tripartite-type tricarboxylate transporter receptor subunit TctC